MAAEDDAADEKDKGPLTYQESKQFNGEFFLINVYDNTKTRKVFFEVYGLDTQDQFHLSYAYSDFDGLFRFNAELMNPNRKEGRFHWISERLSIVTVGKERKLKLQNDPTNEVPELPIYETNRKIPTGRMDLKERQRLRESMDMLDIKRDENIMKRKQLSRQRFLKHIQWLKEEDIRIKKAQDEKLSDERTRRMQMKEDFERRINEGMRAEKERQRIRRERVEVREERTEEADEEDYRQLRSRWKMRDAEQAKTIADARALKAQQREEQRVQKASDKKHAEEIRTKRRSMWAARDDRIKRKNETWLRQVLEIKADRLRKKKQEEERKEEYLKTLHENRQPIFAAQLKRTEERQEAAEAVSKMTNTYHQKRSIPKKVKKKGRNAKSAQKGGTAPENGDDPEAASKEDSVEAKMRAEMDEQNRRSKLERARDRRITALADARKEKMNKRVAELREEDEQIRVAAEEKSAERLARFADMDAQEKAAKEKKQQDLMRLADIREQNTYLREKQRRERMAASAA